MHDIIKKYNDFFERYNQRNTDMMDIVNRKVNPGMYFAKMNDKYSALYLVNKYGINGYIRFHPRSNDKIGDIIVTLFDKDKKSLVGFCLLDDYNYQIEDAILTLCEIYGWTDFISAYETFCADNHLRYPTSRLTHNAGDYNFSTFESVNGKEFLENSPLMYKKSTPESPHSKLTIVSQTSYGFYTEQSIISTNGGTVVIYEVGDWSVGYFYDVPPGLALIFRHYLYCMDKVEKDAYPPIPDWMVTIMPSLRKTVNELYHQSKAVELFSAVTPVEVSRQIHTLIGYEVCE